MGDVHFQPSSPLGGRSFEEYRRMFALSDAGLQLRILGCADGPASFNAESTRRGTRIVSIDPLYQLDARTIRGRIAATYELILEQVQHNTQQFVWDTIQSVAELGRIRMHAMQTFLDTTARHNFGSREYYVLMTLLVSSRQRTEKEGSFHYFRDVD